ncbi:MAG: manganese efflux pump MntP family protein [Spirochaetales bacterium]|nr:manganese efflux pump MntP family protein [Spirochaetales bacterium]
MEWNLIFFVNSVLLGVGLAMDAFSVSIANALSESTMKKSRMCFIAGVYAFFQFSMPMIGWICVHTIVEYFERFDDFIPWIALALLLWIGGKMIWEAVQGEEDEAADVAAKLTFATLMIQGVATSIDALSVGFTIADYGLLMALVASLLIAGVTFAICMTGLLIGKKAGDKLGAKATLAGGLILVGIGIEIFVKGLFF